MSQLSAQQVRELDPHAFLAVLGKRGIHPGGRESTGRLLEWAALKPGERVLATEFCWRRATAHRRRLHRHLSS